MKLVKILDEANNVNFIYKDYKELIIPKNYYLVIFGNNIKYLTLCVKDYVIDGNKITHDENRLVLLKKPGSKTENPVGELLFMNTNIKGLYLVKND